MNRMFKRLAAVMSLSVGLVGLTTLPAFAWQTQQSASAVCDRSTNHVIVTGTFKNNEPLPKSSSTAMDVTALGQTKLAEDGDTVVFTKDIGTAPQPAGSVYFALKWHDGHSGTDSRTAAYGAVADCRTTAYPVAPSISYSEQCGVPDSATTATTTGVNYNPSGTFQGPASFDVVATPKTGFKFVPEPQSRTYHVVLAAARECPRPSATLSITKPKCDSRIGSVTVSNTGNVPVDFSIRFPNRTVSGTLAAGDSRVVSFRIGGAQDRVKASVTYGQQVLASLDKVVKALGPCKVPAHFAPAASFTGPCGDPMYRANLNNSRSNRAVTFVIRYFKYGVGWTSFSRNVHAGVKVSTAYFHVQGGTRLTVSARGDVLRSIVSAPGGNYPACG